MKKMAGITLLILAAIMLFIGISKGILPPALTGIGFIVAGYVFLKERKGT